MKYSLSARQMPSYLTKADEIIVELKDHRIIPDLFIKYPEAIIILNIINMKALEQDTYNIIKQYSEASENFCCCIYELNNNDWFINNQVKYYYGYTIGSYYDVAALSKLQVEYIKITIPLTFDLDVLTRQYPGIKFRMTPNIAYHNYLKRDNGIYGDWIRPEDVKYYEEYIEVFDFKCADLAKERALYDVYAVQKKWSGNLDILITNLNMNIDNRALPEDFGLYRRNCQQKCMRQGGCHYCDVAIKFEHTIRKIHDENQHKDQKTETKDNI